MVPRDTNFCSSKRSFNCTIMSLKRVASSPISSRARTLRTRAARSPLATRNAVSVIFRIGREMPSAKIAAPASAAASPMPSHFSRLSIMSVIGR